ncbi:MAG: Nucleotidyltransferase domain protein [Candidatus Bathyarchaeota archaeon BA2]|nr:MAG: Nucleotidyltransferase domain protein [Candidatus Bathyarchaeota archaeon BA2]
MDIVSVLTQALEKANKARSIKPESEAYASALRWEFYASLQNLLDGLAMIVADLGLRKPGMYSELGSVLREHGVLTNEEEQHIKIIARARNTLAHAYRRLEVGDLSSIEREILPLAETISRKLIGYTTKTGLDPEHKSNTEDLRIKLEPLFKKHKVALAYLFGSRSRGTAKRKSDYDFAILFENDVDILSEIKLSLDIAEALNTPPEMVDVAALNKADTALKYRILKEGRPVYWASRKLKDRWERTTYLQLLELRELYNVFLKKLKIG